MLSPRDGAIISESVFALNFLRTSHVCISSVSKDVTVDLIRSFSNGRRKLLDGHHQRLAVFNSDPRADPRLGEDV